MEDEWEEDESTLVVELSGVIENDFLSKGPLDCQVLGIDTERPLLQLGNYVFAGEYENSLGTSLIFEEKNQDASQSNKPNQESIKDLQYLTRTRKKLCMQRAFIISKEQEAELLLDDVEPPELEPEPPELELEPPVLEREPSVSGASRVSQGTQTNADITKKPRMATETVDEDSNS